MQRPANRAVCNVLLLLGDDHRAQEVTANAANLVRRVDAEQTHLAGIGPDFAGHVARLVPIGLVRLDLLLEVASDHFAEHVVILVEDAPRANLEQRPISNPILRARTARQNAINGTTG